MAKPRKDRNEKELDVRIELVPNAWTRFERFVQDIAKSGPQHRVAKHKPHKQREESKIGKRQRRRGENAKKPGRTRDDN